MIEVRAFEKLAQEVHAPAGEAQKQAMAERRALAAA